MNAHEDQNLAPEQFADLNRVFYRGDPREYFSRRLHSLLLLLSDSDYVQAACREGIGYGRIQATGDYPFSAEQRRDYATVESVVLLHHASEALLRLYFAHADLRPCPWLEVARLRDFRRFKEKVRALVTTMDKEETVKSLHVAFRGYTDAAGFGMEAEEWVTDTKGLKVLVASTAGRFLQEANMYNAAKHGLALLSQELGVELEPPRGREEGIDLSNQGPSLTYLEALDRETGQGRRWHETTTFVNAESYMALTELVVNQMESLWSVARARYLKDFGGVIHPIDPEVVEEVTTGHWKKPFHLPGVSVGLLYYPEGNGDRGRPPVKRRPRRQK